MLFLFSSFPNAMTLAFPKTYPFLPRFFRLASIAILANMMVPLAGLVDTAFLGHLSDINYLAGVILGSILFDYLYRVLRFLRSSTTALTAQAVGKDDGEELWFVGLRGSLIALVIGVGMVLLQYPLQKLGFFLLNGTIAVEQSGIEYFNARIWGAPAVLINFVILGWLIGQERNGLIFLISFVANFANVGFDYWLIYRWDLASAGAGWGTAASQYLALFVALVGIARFADWTVLRSAWEALDWLAFQKIIVFKSHILIRYLILITTFALFINASSFLGTEILTQNGLLLQIAFLSQFAVNGVGMTNQALVANFNIQKRYDYLTPVLSVSLGIAILIALGIASVTIAFPRTIFFTLTNHSDINEALFQYSLWLIPLLSITAITLMFEGYFIGVNATATLRNGTLMAFFFGYLPCIGFALLKQNNHWLWCALVTYMAGLTLFLCWQFIVHFSPQGLTQEDFAEHS